MQTGEQGIKPDFHQLGLRHTGTVPLIEGEPAELLIHLLDQMEVLGETARQIKFQLGGNGHKAELLQYITEELKHQVNK
ncbi:hypothetical protein ES703_47524 [subsurface metagenome]